jgi:hypothetical protein
MRLVLLALPLLLAACSGQEEGSENTSAAQAPAPKPTGPAPKTPVTGIQPEPGKSPAWLGARDNAGAPLSAPYGNLLDQPVVSGAALGIVPARG